MTYLIPIAYIGTPTTYLMPVANIGIHMTYLIPFTYIGMPMTYVIPIANIGIPMIYLIPIALFCLFAVNSEWLLSPEGLSPPAHYFCTSKLNVWSNCAEQVQEALSVSRKRLSSYFQQKHTDLVAQITGTACSRPYTVYGSTALVEDICAISNLCIQALKQSRIFIWRMLFWNYHGELENSEYWMPVENLNTSYTVCNVILIIINGICCYCFVNEYEKLIHQYPFSFILFNVSAIILILSSEFEVFLLIKMLT